MNLEEEHPGQCTCPRHMRGWGPWGAGMPARVLSQLPKASFLMSLTSRPLGAHHALSERSHSCTWWNDWSDEKLNPMATGKKNHLGMAGCSEITKTGACCKFPSGLYWPLWGSYSCWLMRIDSYLSCSWIYCSRSNLEDTVRSLAQCML